MGRPKNFSREQVLEKAMPVQGASNTEASFRGLRTGEVADLAQG